MKTYKPQLNIIMPSRNEEDSIIVTLKQLDKKIKVPHKVIIVDDSSDNTESLVRDYAKTHKNIKLIHSKPNTISFGKALKLGREAAGDGVVVVVMADLCDDPATINLMYEKIKEGWDIVCGSRYTKGGSKKGGPKIQSFFSRLVCASLHLLTRIPTTDVSNAFKMYRKEAVDKVSIDTSAGVEASMSIVLQCYFNGAKITDVPTRWEGRTQGKSKFKILQRTPKYYKIYWWALMSTIKMRLHLESLSSGSTAKRVSRLTQGFIKFFDKYYPWSALVFLALIVIAALWQVSNLYFWTDDWDLFLKVAHPELGLWGMDPGWFGSGPYRYLHTPFMPFFPIFGLNPTPYFIGSILVYFIATVSVFLLFLEITQKKSLSIGAAAIYASAGYIGSYTIFHLSNSYQNLGAVILTTLTLWILAKYYRTNNILYYLLSLFLFYASLEIENLRAHGLIFLVLGLTVLYCRWRKSIPHILFNLLKLIPFILIYRSMYSATLGTGKTRTVGAFFYTMWRDKLFPHFISPFASFSDVVVPDNITKLAYGIFGKSQANIVPEIILVIAFTLVGLFLVLKSKHMVTRYLAVLFVILEIAYFFFNRWAVKQPMIFLVRDATTGFTSMLGMTLLLVSLLVGFRFLVKGSNIGKSILFGIILIFGHYIGYFIGVPANSYLTTTDRYLTPSVVGTALLLGSLFYVIKVSGLKKINLFPILCFTYALYLIILMNMTAHRVVNDVSRPARRIYETIKSITPAIPKNSILLLDFENDPNLKYQVNSSFPNTAFALFYGFGNRVPLVYSFEEYLYKVKKGQMKIDDLVSFYIAQDSVVDTTKRIINLMKNPVQEVLVGVNKWNSNTTLSKENLSTQSFVVEREKNTVGINPKLEARVNYPSIVPAMLSLTLTAVPIDIGSIKFPYRDVTAMVPDEIIKEDLENMDLNDGLGPQLPCKEVSLLLELDRAHHEFMEYAKIETTSEANYSEKEFLTDGLFDTNWNGFILTWSDKKKEEIVMDLGTTRSIDKLIWVNYLKRNGPTDYDIFVSNDKKTWEKARQIRSGPVRTEGEFVVEDLGERNVHYVKMTITNTFSNLSPSISEIWVSSTKGIGLKEYSQNIVDTPLHCPISSLDEYRKIEGLLKPFVKARMWWLTDSWESYSRSNSKNLEIIADGLPHVYNLYIPAQGTMLDKIMISEFQLPVNITIDRATIRSLTFEEIDKLGYIRKPTGSSN